MKVMYEKLREKLHGDQQKYIIDAFENEEKLTNYENYEKFRMDENYQRLRTLAVTENSIEKNALDIKKKLKVKKFQALNTSFQPFGKIS